MGILNKKGNLNYHIVNLSKIKLRILSLYLKDLSKSLRVDSLYYNKDFAHDLILNFSKSAPKFCLDFEDFIEGLNEEKSEELRGVYKK